MAETKARIAFYETNTSLHRAFEKHPKRSAVKNIRRILE